MIPLSATTRRYKRFIQGPLPLEWFQKASLISATAGVIGMIIWQIAYEKKKFGRSGQRYRSKPIRLSNQMTEKYGVHRHAKMSALKKMEDEGLIRLRLPKGSSPEVLIIDSEVFL